MKQQVRNDINDWLKTLTLRQKAFLDILGNKHWQEGWNAHKRYVDLLDDEDEENENTPT